MLGIDQKHIFPILVFLILAACNPPPQDIFASEFEDLNQSITMSLIDMRDSDYGGKYISVAIHNQTQGEIAFPPGYQVQIFYYEPASSEWKPLKNEIRATSDSELFILKDKGQMEDTGMITFMPDRSIPLDTIRVLVVGNVYLNGKKTEKQVAAWMEINIAQLETASQTTPDGSQQVVDLSQSIPATPDFNTSANESFFAHERIQADAPANINQGITFERGLTWLNTAGFPTPHPNEMCFIVFNHTHEDVFFEGRYFEAQLFTYDAAMNTWTKFSSLENDQAFTLPAGLETALPQVENSFCLGVPDFSKAMGSEVRIYISGRGVASNERYGAYVDVAIVLSASP